MAVQKETFGREIVRPEREVEFRGSEIAAFIQSQFSKVDKIENDRRTAAWEKSGRRDEPPKTIHTKVLRSHLYLVRKTEDVPLPQEERLYQVIK